MCLLFPTWNSPPGWTGPEAVFYISFDCLDGLDVMEGASPAQTVPTIAGKVFHFEFKNLF